VLNCLVILKWKRKTVSSKKRSHKVL
jgi:hypothetical protein